MLNDNGIVKLMDFGLSRAMDRGRITNPDVIKGKLSYMAPELTFGEEATTRAQKQTRTGGEPSESGRWRTAIGSRRPRRGPNWTAHEPRPHPAREFAEQTPLGRAPDDRRRPRGRTRTGTN